MEVDRAASLRRRRRTRAPFPDLPLHHDRYAKNKAQNLLAAAFFRLDRGGRSGSSRFHCRPLGVLGTCTSRRSHHARLGDGARTKFLLFTPSNRPWVLAVRPSQRQVSWRGVSARGQEKQSLSWPRHTHSSGYGLLPKGGHEVGLIKQAWLDEGLHSTTGLGSHAECLFIAVNAVFRFPGRHRVETREICLPEILLVG
ncbi:hypothetical protein EV126DRAFT_435111 [Verticillium dahliae]|nr:hypothetical protein EV126DRAFT_436838 [Verticillium dahliae]KAH6681279.1 hypothetical protein EV126DRAFT_435111 [Verticillium dahliae]